MTAATGTWSKASKRRATDRSTALARAGGVIARVAIATSSATPRFYGAALTGGWGEPIATLTDGTLGRRLQAGSRNRAIPWGGGGGDHRTFADDHEQGWPTCA